MYLNIEAASHFVIPKPLSLLSDLKRVRGETTCEYFDKMLNFNTYSVHKF